MYFFSYEAILLPLLISFNIVFRWILGFSNDITWQFCVFLPNEWIILKHKAKKFPSHFPFLE